MCVCVKGRQSKRVGGEMVSNGHNKKFFFYSLWFQINKKAFVADNATG